MIAAAVQSRHVTMAETWTLPLEAALDACEIMMVEQENRRLHRVATGQDGGK